MNLVAGQVHWARPDSTVGREQSGRRPVIVVSGTGYHDAITMNDNAVVEVAELMGWASRGEADLGFLPADLKAAAAAAHDRAVQLLLGHSKLESTVRYLGIEVDDALEISEQTEI